MALCPPSVRPAVRRRGSGSAGCCSPGAALACATGAPAPPQAGTGTVLGHLRLVPREGVTPVKPGALALRGSAHERRRVRRLLEARLRGGLSRCRAQPGGTAELADPHHRRADTARPSARGGRRGRQRSSCATAPAPRTCFRLPASGCCAGSSPASRSRSRLRGGGRASRSSCSTCRASGSTVFVSPGPFAVVSGRRPLRAERPRARQPPRCSPGIRASPRRAPRCRSRQDSIVRLDLEMGVDQRDDAPASAPADLP